MNRAFCICSRESHIPQVAGKGVVIVMKDFGFEKRQMCDTQGRLFMLAWERGLDCPIFIKKFMNSHTVAALDQSYHRFQWAGEEYLLEELNEETGGLPVAGMVYPAEVMYWMGYLYRYWHYRTGESSVEIYRFINAAAMRKCWYSFHIFDMDMAVDKIREMVKEK